MNLYINNFSYASDEIGNIESVLSSFILICERIRSYSFDKVYMPNDFKSKEVLFGESFVSFIKNNNFDKNLRNRLSGLISNQLKGIMFDEIEDNTIQYVKLNGVESEFLKRAFNTSTPVISFPTKEAYRFHILEVFNEYLNSELKEIKENAILNNLSEISHFTDLKDLLYQKQLKINALKSKWDALEKPIRFIETTNQYLIDTNYELKWANGNTNIRVSLANDIGTSIAIMNGWEYKSGLSKKNNRKVFMALNQIVYLSIDTQHGTFEIHKRNGKHFCEINFKGELMEGAQTNHDLKI